MLIYLYSINCVGFATGSACLLRGSNCVFKYIQLKGYEKTDEMLG